jgi:hypothetical protein
MFPVRATQRGLLYPFRYLVAASQLTSTLLWLIKVQNQVALAEDKAFFSVEIDREYLLIRQDGT